MGADFDQISLTLRSGLDEPDYKAALTTLAIVTDFGGPDDIDTYCFYAELGKEDLRPDGRLIPDAGRRLAYRIITDLRNTIGNRDMEIIRHPDRTEYVTGGMDWSGEQTDAFGVFSLVLALPKPIRDALGLVDESEPTFLRTTVSTAVNKATDDIMAVAQPNDDEGFLTDLTNLIVNAALHYLEHPDADLDDVLEAEYGDADDIRAIKDEISGGSW